MVGAWPKTKNHNDGVQKPLAVSCTSGPWDQAFVLALNKPLSILNILACLLISKPNLKSMISVSVVYFNTRITESWGFKFQSFAWALYQAICHSFIFRWLVSEAEPSISAPLSSSHLSQYGSTHAHEHYFIIVHNIFTFKRNTHPKQGPKTWRIVLACVKVFFS